MGGTLRQPACGRRRSGVVGGDGLVGLAVLVLHLTQVGAAQGDVGGRVVQAFGAGIGQACALGHRRGGGRQQLHQAACVGRGTRIGIEHALGADLGGDPGRVQIVAAGRGADVGVVVQGETRLVHALLVGGLAQREHRPIEPALLLCQGHRGAAAGIVETAQCIVPLAHRPAGLVDPVQGQRTLQGRVAGHFPAQRRRIVGVPRAQCVGQLQAVGGQEAVEGRRSGGGAEQRLRLGRFAGLLQHPPLEPAPARILALGGGHRADCIQRRLPVGTRHRLARAPLVQALVVAGCRHRGQPPRRIGQVGGHRPQRDLVQHLAALGLVHAQQRGQLRELAFGCVRIVLRQTRQAGGGDLTAACIAWPLCGACMRGLDEGGVVLGQGQRIGGQAACGAAHHPGLAFGHGQVEALPAQGIVQATARGQGDEGGVAGVGLRLATAPQRLRFGVPFGAGLAQRLLRVEPGAAQGGAVAGAPVGEEIAPALAPRKRGQPQRAQRGGGGLAVVALQEAAHLGGVCGIQVAGQARVFEPRPARIGAQRLGLVRCQAAALGRGDRRLHGGVVVAAGIGRLGRDGQWQGQQQGRQGGHAQPPDEAVRAWGGGGGRHAVEYTQRA